MHIASSIAKTRGPKNQVIRSSSLEDTDAEFTLNLLQITTKEKELCIKKTDSDFFRDFNASSRVRNSLTNGSEFCCCDTPDL